MPVRSFNSRVLKWPGRAEVIAAIRQWVERERATHPELLRAGYFGSLTDGNRYGVGSDADVIFVVTHSSRDHWYERPLDFNIPLEVPVDVDLMVFTEDELPNARLGEIIWL